MLLEGECRLPPALGSLSKLGSFLLLVKVSKEEVQGVGEISVLTDQYVVIFVVSQGFNTLPLYLSFASLMPFAKLTMASATVTQRWDESGISGVQDLWQDINVQCFSRVMLPILSFQSKDISSLILFVSLDHNT